MNLNTCIQNLLRDQAFKEEWTVLEKIAWNSFREVPTKFFEIGKMRLKVRFLHSHLNSFPENLGHFSKEQGFHQDIKEMERCYQDF